MNFPVEILLSTFNGEKYLETQLDSIIRQDYSYWKLLIRDDGSTDSTLSIVRKYIQEYPGKIMLLTDDNGNIGYARSFSKLLSSASANYLMFCDQDDYWEPFKIAVMLSRILKEEAIMPQKAYLVFSDLQMTDSDLNVTEPSFLKMTGYSSKVGTQIFFLKNYIPGCNIMFNRKLIEIALKTDNLISLHDHWLLMVCAASGKINCIDEPLMKYRMHPYNAIGYVELQSIFFNRLGLFIKDILKYGFANKKYRERLYIPLIRQMQNICERLPAEVLPEAITFSEIDKSGYFSRKVRNVSKPYILEKSLLKQLTYIFCF